MWTHYVSAVSMCNIKGFQIFKPGARRPVRTWFLEIVPVRTSVCVCVCVCVSASEAINN